MAYCKCSTIVLMANPESTNITDQAEPKRVLPSAFMRSLRPEYYSDTKRLTRGVLSRAVLENQLETITSRNQTHDFEVFCRKLCERTICPNLRVQTGPDGGGDSKADTETYPVADEISTLTYVGDTNSGKERWAFAFSAKAKWAEKIRSDVAGLIATGRSYDRIICVTSRFAKAKTRADLEDELTKAYGVPVTVHDRSWIVKEVIEEGRTDLAFNYLKIGESFESGLRLGPTDYSRAQQLEDAERLIEDPAAFQGMESQRVTEALVAAKLSRGLERPRVETDGRFMRAIRLADANGTYRQRLEARYEQLWTAFWWFDDFPLLLASYDDFQSLALETDHAKNLELLGNLNQLLVNCVIHGHVSREASRLDERTEKLRHVLELSAADPARPNNSLEAQTALLRIRLNDALLAQHRPAPSQIWKELGVILEKAEGLGEFDADGLVSFIEVAGPIAGNDPAYNELVEKLATFVGSRRSEGEGALILLKRAQSLDFDDHFDMIRWLGKAAIGLTKREYADKLIAAAQLLTLAYRSAGLLWAARATGFLTAASIIIESEIEGEMRVQIVPTMKVWAWNALVLGHLPDFLFALQLMRGFLAGLPLDEESRERVQNDIRELDAALGCLFLNLEDAELCRLKSAPDILEALGLFMARMALLYALGYQDTLWEDGSLPPEESEENFQRLLSLLKGQPVAKSLGGPLTLNTEGPQTFNTTLLGMKVEVQIQDSHSIIIAEAILGSLEAFFATVISEGAAAHAELFRIIVTLSDADKPSIETNELDMIATVLWPRNLTVARFDQQRDVYEFLVEIAANVMAAACILHDAETLIEKLYTDDAIHHRIMMIWVAANSYNRVTSRWFFSLVDWNRAVKRTYPLLDNRPKLPHVVVNAPPEDLAYASEPGENPFHLNNHRAVRVGSVIDIHAWDQAMWSGCGYMEYGPQHPPVMALLFKDSAAARKIFERWRGRFGVRDVNNEIVLSIIRNLPDSNPHHYCVQVSSKHPASTPIQPKQAVMMAARSLIMEPSNSVNLERFIAGYRRTGAFYLIPAIGLAQDDFFLDLAILKGDINIKSADEVGSEDVEALALRIRGMKVTS